ncbi:hypothetical protein [Roseibium sp. Sym1]|uniref:hypothetical protein n=1 Tax=Roseibium sp. Sym1 TaxID=3016006 RepID=UPI0022B4AB47|nr:hypothetical protein [Roseibium sp. Sym1]
MTELSERRVRHLKQLEANHNRDFWSRFGNQTLDADTNVLRLSDAMCADWNRKQKAEDGGSAPAAPLTAPRPLPRGWRKEHWKTQQVMAADYAGVRAATKADAVEALEAYENGPALPPAA